MDEILLLDATERYLNGEMNAEEKAMFEQLRETNQEVDQMVVEHSFFLQQFGRYGGVREMKHSLHEVHNQLLQDGEIKEEVLSTSAKVVNMWKRYKRTITIAASIAGITAISISSMTLLFTPKSNDKQVQELVNSVKDIKGQLIVQDKKINHIANATKIPTGTSVTGFGSAFLVDGKGYLVTNAHVLRNAKGIIVLNSKGAEFKAIVVKIDESKDIAILKIVDKDYKSIGMLPYSIRKSSTDIAEPIFTLGYPRNEIVYGEGYLSAKTGFNGDTLSCQIAVAANPGNSGGPVFNKNGEVIGILSTKETKADGVVFAIQSKYIIETVNQLKKDDSTIELKLPSKSSVKGMGASEQVKKIQDYVYMVKVY
ncbi:serine protease [Lacibacter sp.]|jgi:serine protease Do|uniref:S1C family serine protease n=1 Tax=Lacibacter sp. TaxID=1915409 RepID=UPI002B4B7774|nr:serine protease [Lacibacter sp.]HLP37274.1 serine protease [Lacibacter sp.]